MAKKIIANVKLQVAAGKATPAPPVGSALGPHGRDMRCCIEAMSYLVKTVKDLVAIKT